MKKTILCDAKNCKSNYYGKCLIEFYQFELDSEGKCKSYKDKDEYEARLKGIDEFWDSRLRKSREKVKGNE